MKWLKKLQVCHNKLIDDREKWQKRLDVVDEQLDKSRSIIHDNKQVHRSVMMEMIDRFVDKEDEMKDIMCGLKQMNYQLAQKLKVSTKETRAAEKVREHWKSLSQKRQAKLLAMQAEKNALKDEVARLAKLEVEQKKTLDKYQAMVNESQHKRLELKKMFDENRGAGRKGGGRRWPVWVVQLISELLAHGTAPSTIPANIETMYHTLYGVKPKEVPSVNFVRQCRVVVQVLGETITAVKLASAEKWDQLWADATSRRQTSFQALIIGIMGEDDNIDPVVVSSCIFAEDEKSDTQAESVIAKVRIVLYCIVLSSTLACESRSTTFVNL